jgi:DNA-binding PadR family transcriptional regulator
MVRELFLGFIRVHILHHAAEGPVYGLALMREVRRHGYAVSPGTLYPVLHGLERAGYLAREARLVAGKVRKYYTITARGRRALGAAREKIEELVEEVLKGRGPRNLSAPHGSARRGGGERRGAGVVHRDGARLRWVSRPGEARGQRRRVVPTGEHGP